MKKEKEFIVWQNYDINLSDYQEFLEEEYPDVTDTTEQYHLVSTMNDEYLDDERSNFSSIDRLNGDIIIIADLGLWNRRAQGYKEIYSRSASDCLQFEKDCDYAKWYVDERNDLCSRQSHHDGSHHLIYRSWKEGLSDRQKQNFREKLYYGRATRRDITRYTDSIGVKVKELYGWV